MLTAFPKLVVALLLLMTADISIAACPDKKNCDKEHEYLELPTTGGLHFKGVAYVKQPLTGDYIAAFKRRNGFRVVDSSGRVAPTAVSAKQFVAALERLITRLLKEGRGLDEIQVDLDVVGDLWIETRAAVKRAVRAGRGPLYSKDPAATEALRKSIGETRVRVDFREVSRSPARNQSCLTPLIPKINLETYWLVPYALGRRWRQA